ncbi:MAG: FAD-dependent oxidoreductase [Candidatus Tectimicrobiota bacterium]
MTKSKGLLVLVIVALIAAFFIFDLKQYFSLTYFTQQQAAITAYHTAHPLQTALIYMLVYVGITALSLPGAAVMTLVGGAIFGTFLGTVLVSFASCVGATLAFLSSRFLLRDTIQAKYGERLRVINAGIAKDGAFYLFTLRMVPLIPFFVVNLVMGLSSIRTWTFYWVSQVGMLFGTIVYVNAGTQLGKVAEGGRIFTPQLLIAFTCLALLGPIAKWCIDRLRAQKVYAPWKQRKPATFERNMVVIGAGAAGLVSAYIAAAIKAKVTLVEKHLMGGDCLNFGCVPSKALIRSAKLLSHIRRAQEFGLDNATAQCDFAAVMERVQRVIGAVAPHDSVERYTGLGVEVLQGEAKITSPWHVEVQTAEGTRTLSTRSIVVATGAAPFVPPIPGLDEVGYLTSDTVWGLRDLPPRLVVLGGGPIGAELAQAFARLGSQVTQVEMLPRLMMREDPEVSDLVLAKFRSEGINVLVNHRAKACRLEQGEKVLVAEQDGKEVCIPFDQLLCAVGRVARTSGFGLEELGIGLTRSRTIEVDEYLRTKYPNITACGDVAGPYQFTHTAAHTAYYAATNALFGGLKKSRANFTVIPWCTFTEPEVARVGLNETEAQEKHIAYEVTRYGIDDLDRAIADGEAHGFVKVLTVPGKDRILGVTIVGEHAGDLIAEYVLAMRHGMGLGKIMSTIHIYPTLAEANKYAAGEWRKAHQPALALKWLERFHAWRRG